MHRFSKIPYVALAKLSLVATLSANTSFTTAAHSELHSSIVTLPTFSASSNLKRNPGVNIDLEDVATLDSMMLIGGTGHKKLSQEIADIIQVPLANTSIGRFADGEVTVQVNENIRSKDVYIIQPCYQPVHDSIVELLLTISCVRRAGAERVIAVIPYLGYKHHRRGSPISTKHHSRYLTSAAVDFAKMLEEVGVDRVISVDLQRPGQGHEACFFDNNIPLETIMTTDHQVKFMLDKIQLNGPIVVVSPNTEMVKKARKFQLGFKKVLQTDDIHLAVFASPDSGSGPYDVKKLELLGNPNFKDAEVIIVDDMVDTACKCRMITYFF